MCEFYCFLLALELQAHWKQCVCFIHYCIPCSWNNAWHIVGLQLIFLEWLLYTCNSLYSVIAPLYPFLALFWFPGKPTWGSLTLSLAFSLCQPKQALTGLDSERRFLVFLLCYFSAVLWLIVTASLYLWPDLSVGKSAQHLPHGHSPSWFK